MKKYFIHLVTLGIALNSPSFGQETEQQITDVFTASNLEILDSSGFSFSTNYTPSGSSWDLSYSEESVFKALLKYNHPSDPNKSFDLRIGKGGQIYSFIGSFGESIPPQWRNPNVNYDNYGGGKSYAPWVDEVWQMVAVDGAKNASSPYFIHQAGVYLKTPEQTKPFYSPIIAEYFNAQEQSYTVVNWGQQAHTDHLDASGYTSGMLYYTKYTIIGEGIIQVDQMMYNFSNDEMNFINVPWGGVRSSNLGHFFISNANNTFVPSPGVYGQYPKNATQTNSTAGWMAWSDNPAGLSPTLGTVHYRETSTRVNVFRYGHAGLPNQNHVLNNDYNDRNYFVFEMIRQPLPGQLNFGKAMSFRYFYVLGKDILNVRDNIINNKLVANTTESLHINSKNDSQSLFYDFQATAEGINTTSTNTGIELKASPYSNSYPVFKISSNSNADVITSNPYHFSKKPYDGLASDWKLLGFRDHKTAITVTNDTIPYGSSYTLPDGTILDSMIQSGQYIYSDMVAANEEIISVTNIVILNSPEKNTSVSIVDNNRGNTIRVYPNPTTGKVSIQSTGLHFPLRVSITNISGQEVFKASYTSKQKLDFEIKENPGQYFIHVVDSNQKTKTIAIIKK